jgi:protein-export membrane protein SecD
MYYSPAKIAGIVLALLISLVLSMPNFLPAEQQNYARDTFGLRPMTLGLDLQGGSNIVLEVDREHFVDKTLKPQLQSDIRTVLREQKIAFSAPVRTANGASVKITKLEDLDKATTALNTLRQPIGGDIFGSTSAVNLVNITSDAAGQFNLEISSTGLEAKIAQVVAQAIEVFKRRIDGLGTTEATIQQQGKDRVSVQVPGLQNPERVKDLLGGTGKLTFQLLCDEQRTGPTQTVPPDCKEYEVKPDATNPNQPKVLWVQTSSRATVDGADLNDAQPSIDQNNRSIVTFRFNQRGAVKFGNLTKANVGKPFAIILDDIIQSYPVIQSPILGGTGQISGNFTTEETRDLAITLRSGALPARFAVVEERTVGPSLGSDSIKAGVLAALIGLVGVMAFMLLPYGLFGVIANLALLGNLLLLLAIMSFFGFTLTLPGIAGIVLTLGMAVDSNVLIYERIREEWRNGRTALNSIETGFKAALGTVLDANITTLIAGVVLFGIGSGPIRGFAVTLSVGIFTTMFTAFTLTRLLVSLWVKYRRPKEINL